MIGSGGSRAVRQGPVFNAAMMLMKPSRSVLSWFSEVIRISLPIALDYGGPGCVRWLRGLIV